MPRRRGTQRTYVATHGRVPGGRSGQTALNSRGRGRGNPRSRAFNSLAAEALARVREPGAGSWGKGAERGALGPPGARPPRPVGAQAAGASGQPRGSGRIVSGFPALLSRPHRLRLPLPSPASRAPRDADFGRTPEEAGSFLSSAREPFPLRAPSLCLLLLHFSVPDAAAASCHHPSSQHGGRGSSCRSASRGPAESTAPLPRAFLATTASAFLHPPTPLSANTECVTTETTLEHHGKCSLRGGVGVGSGTPKAF